MSQNRFGQDSLLRRSNQPPSMSFSPSERPHTPLFLMKMSSADQYKQNLEENLTGYLTSSERQKETNSLDSFLLPKDVNYYFTETDKIKAEIEKISVKEKELLGLTIDKFLEKVIAVCEAKRSDLERVIDGDVLKLNKFYDNLCQNIRSFLQQAQIKLDSKMDSLSETKNQNNDFNNPLVNQLNKLQFQRRKMEVTEMTIAEIYNDYSNSSINEGKTIIEKVLIEKVNDNPDKKWLSVNRRVLTNSLDSMLNVIERELKSIKISEEDHSLRSFPSDHASSLTKGSVNARVFSPAVWDKLNPNRDQGAFNNSLTKFSEESKMSQPMVFGFSNGFNQAKDINRPGSTGTNISFLNLNLKNAVNNSPLSTIPEEHKFEKEKSNYFQSLINPKEPGFDSNKSKVLPSKSGYLNIYNFNNKGKEQTSIYQKQDFQNPDFLFMMYFFW